MSLELGKRETSPTIATIFAARIGPTPKISVSMVPEAFTSPAIRSSRSAIRRSKVRTSRTTSAARRLRTRPAGCCGLARRNNFGGGIGRELQSPQSLPVGREGLLPDQVSVLVDGRDNGGVLARI